MEKISSFQITNIRLSGFKSFSEPTEVTLGNQTVITGGNGRGKSSLADAIAFAITGLPFFGERRIDRLHSDDNPNLFVSLRLVDGDGAAHELTRTRKANRMTITYDGYEIRQMDLTEMFGERDVFLSIFNPLYFIEELGDDGKNLLQRYLPLIPQETILEKLSDAVRESLDGMQLTSPEGHIKCLREEIRELEDSILYLQGQQDLAAAQSEQGDRTTRELNERLTALRQEQAELEQKRFEGLDTSAMQRELVELSAQYSDLSGEPTADSEIDDLNARVLELGRKLGERQGAVYEPKYAKPAAEAAQRVRMLGERYKKETGIFNSIMDKRVCPTCHRSVTEADAPTIKAVFQKSLEEIVADGKEQRAQLDELDALEQKAQDTFLKFQQEDIADIEAQLEKATQARDLAAAAANEAAQQGADRREHIRMEIQTLTADLECGKLSAKEYGRLQACGEEIRQAEAELTALQKTVAAPPEDYAGKIQTAKAAIREKKDKVNSLLFYLSKRAELTFEQLHMNRVAISLYDVVKTTGEFKDTFKFTYNGRRYDRLSLSEKIRAGMEVSELIKKLTGRNYPVFVDNMESVDDLANVQPTGQIIMARCVRGAALDIKAIKPIVTQVQQAA